MKSLISVFQVSDIDQSLNWYKKWLGEPDVIPMEGMAEYQIAPNAWLQLFLYYPKQNQVAPSDENSDNRPSAIVIGVEDIHLTQKTLQDNGIEVSDIADYEVVLTIDVFDPDGNQITFVQEV